MSNFDALTLWVKAGTATVATVSSVAATEYIVPMWGTTPFSFVLAAIGSVMSYAWDKREDNGMALIFKTISVTLFSVALVVVLPDLAGWELRPKSEPPLAFILALYGRHIIPAMKKMVPTIARGIAGMFSSRNNPPMFDEPPADVPFTDDPTRSPRPPRSNHRPTDNDEDRGY